MKTMTIEKYQSEKALIAPQDYGRFLSDLKKRIRSAQIKAARSVNRGLIALYWDLGLRMVEKQKRKGWGEGVIRKIAQDLQKAFPGMNGFSQSNIWRMRAFYLAYARPYEKLAQPVREIFNAKLPQAVADIPWGHNILLLEKIKIPEERLWYARKTVENGWSRAVLWHQIESRLYQRQRSNKKTTNFRRTLPLPQSDLAVEVIKDPYNFDFLSLAEDARERDLEKGLLDHIRAFLIELGKGFAFVGSQQLLRVGNEDFYVDLLFYHLQLRCFIVIDLKMTEFKPEYTGQMNFYLSAVDSLMGHKGDHPSIGIILCKSKNKLIAEYALRDTCKPIGVATYKVTHKLPHEYKKNLPTVRELEDQLKTKK